MPALVKHITAAYTVDHRSDDLILISDAADLVITLPEANKASKGKKVTVITQSLSTGTGTSLAVRATDLIQGKGISSPAAGKGAVNSGGTDALGDLLEVTSDGNGVWQVTNVLGTWARAA